MYLTDDQVANLIIALIAIILFYQPGVIRKIKEFRTMLQAKKERRRNAEEKLRKELEADIAEDLMKLKEEVRRGA